MQDIERNGCSQFKSLDNKALEPGPTKDRKTLVFLIAKFKTKPNEEKYQKQWKQQKKSYQHIL